MGEELLEIEYKFLLITLDKIMKTDDLYQLKNMFLHAADRLELIFRTRYKKLLEKDIVKATFSNGKCEFFNESEVEQ